MYCPGVAGGQSGKVGGRKLAFAIGGLTSELKVPIRAEALAPDQVKPSAKFHMPARCRPTHPDFPERQPYAVPRHDIKMPRRAIALRERKDVPTVA